MSSTTSLTQLLNWAFDNLSTVLFSFCSPTAPPFRFLVYSIACLPISSATIHCVAFCFYFAPFLLMQWFTTRSDLWFTCVLDSLQSRRWGSEKDCQGKLNELGIYPSLENGAKCLHLYYSRVFMAIVPPSMCPPTSLWKKPSKINTNKITKSINLPEEEGCHRTLSSHGHSMK